MDKWKLLLHVPESNRFELALKVASNFIKAIGNESYSVRVLVNAEGITVLTRFDEVKNLFQEALSQGVEVYFCENAIRTFNIDPSLLPKGSGTVPFGIKALVEWQSEGYKYVRA